MKLIILFLFIITGCANSQLCYNKVGIEKENCENAKKLHENDWRNEHRFDRPYDRR